MCVKTGTRPSGGPSLQLRRQMWLLLLARAIRTGLKSQMGEGAPLGYSSLLHVADCIDVCVHSVVTPPAICILFTIPLGY